MGRRFILALGLFILVPVFAAKAACSDKPLALTEAAFEDALLRRVHAMGVTQIVPVTKLNGKDYFRLAGASTRLFFGTTANQVTSIGAVLASSGTPADIELLNVIAVFTLAKISGLPEAEIGLQLRPLLASLAVDSKSVRSFGTATIIMTKTKDVTSLLMGQLSCE